MLIVDFVFAVSQGDFFGSKICQGAHAYFEATIFGAHPPAYYTPGLLPVRTLGSERLTSTCYPLWTLPGGRNVTSKC